MKRRGKTPLSGMDKKLAGLAICRCSDCAKRRGVPFAISDKERERLMRTGMVEVKR